MNHLRNLLDSLQNNITTPIGSRITEDQLDRMADWCTSGCISFTTGYAWVYLRAGILAVLN